LWAHVGDNRDFLTAAREANKKLPLNIDGEENFFSLDMDAGDPLAIYAGLVSATDPDQKIPAKSQNLSPHHFNAHVENNGWSGITGVQCRRHGCGENFWFGPAGWEPARLNPRAYLHGLEPGLKEAREKLAKSFTLHYCSASSHLSVLRCAIEAGVLCERGRVLWKLIAKSGQKAVVLRCKKFMMCAFEGCNKRSHQTPL
jgi:hypothetical protein